MSNQAMSNKENQGNQGNQGNQVKQKSAWHHYSNNQTEIDKLLHRVTSEYRKYSRISRPVYNC